MLDQLPVEIQMKILSHLCHNDLGYGMALVNRHFRRISLDPILWTRIEVCICDPSFALALIRNGSIADKWPKLESVVIKYDSANVKTLNINPKMTNIFNSL